MKTIHRALLALTALAVIPVTSLHAVPLIISYQGRVAVGSTNFNGPAAFKFALIDASGTTTYWSNNGTSVAGSEPSAAVTLTVTNGLYSVLLGDATLTNMTAIPSSVFSNDFVRLRVWFNDGINGSQLLAPDQRIAAVGYAMMAASVPSGAITSTMIANGAVGSTQLATNAVQSSNIAAGAVGSTQLAANAVQSSKIAAGAVGSTQIAAGAVGSTQLAAGAVTFSDLAKPYQSGTVTGAALVMDFGKSTFSVVFPQAFSSTPVVTVSMAIVSNASPLGDATVQLVTSSTTGFTGRFEANTSVPVTVDTQGIAGVLGTSLRVINGNPAIAYHDFTGADLKYARASDIDGNAWNTPVLVDGAVTAVGRYPSMAVAVGNPAVSYYDGTNSALRYARASDANGATWGASAVVDLGNPANFGQHLSQAIVSSNPAVSYYDATNGDLMFVRATDANGVVWDAPVIVTSTSDIGQFTSLAVVSGNPAIGYHDVTNGDLKFVRANDATGTSWGAPVTVDNTATVIGQYTSLAVVNGNPAISYYDATNGNLRFARATTTTGSAWAVPVTVASTNNVGQFSSLVVVSNFPAISYHDATTGDLMYVRATDLNGTAWSAPVIADNTATVVGQHTSMAIVNGNPAIGYYDATNADLRFVRSTNTTGTAWAAPQTLDSSGNVGEHTSLVVLSTTGFPAIAYYSASTSGLKFVRATDTSGTAWGTPQLVEFADDVGQFASMVIANSHPGIAYYEATHGALRFIISPDQLGDAWQPPIYLDTTGDVGQDTSMAIVNGNPAISYYDVTNANLKYVRSSESSGSAWVNAPVVIDSAGDVGQHTSLAIVNGNPAISYYDNTSDNLKYLRANDVNGTTWGTPVIVDATGQVGEYTSLAVVNGNPAISYHDATNLELKFVRANDADGATWGAPVILDSVLSTGKSTSLAVVNGNPAVSYSHSSNSDLKYVRALDVNGSTWGVSVVLDSSGNVGINTSMAIVHGAPAISYHDATNGAVKYIREANPTGTTIHWIALPP